MYRIGRCRAKDEEEKGGEEEEGLEGEFMVKRMVRKAFLCICEIAISLQS